MPVCITWFINRVSDLIMADSIIFSSFEEMPPQLFFVAGHSIVFFVNFITTFLIPKSESTCF